jgi:hypothetical protein
MKKAAHILVAIIVGLLASVQLSAQCIPDTLHCVDTTGNPGEICPLDLPDGSLNMLYNETITIIPPGTYPLYNQEAIIVFIEIDSVKNLPPGIDYFPNADVFFPDTAYCIQLNGAPTQAGEFGLSIYITATVDLNLEQLIEVQVVDDTSLSITVVGEVGLGQNQMREFRVIPNVPNPFSETTRLSFYTPSQERVELYIYNILGSLMHHESELAAPGTHNFSFNGIDLQPGTYLYRVKIRGKYFTGKLMKSR